MGLFIIDSGVDVLGWLCNMSCHKYMFGYFSADKGTFSIASRTAKSVLVGSDLKKKCMLKKKTRAFLINVKLLNNFEEN